MVANSVLHELQHYLGWPGGLFVNSICFAGRLGWPAAVCPLGSLPGLGAEPSHDCPHMTAQEAAAIHTCGYQPLIAALSTA